jgi:hypothetical protein
MTNSILLLLALPFAIACCVAFAYYYSRKEYNESPVFTGQLRSLSGIIACNKPLFGFLLHCLAGMLLLAQLNLLDTDADKGKVYILCMVYISLSALINFDIFEHNLIHLFSLTGFLVFSLSFALLCSHTMVTLVMSRIYYSVTGIFGIVILYNKWLMFRGYNEELPVISDTKPHMTVQAILEVIWALCFVVCMFTISAQI